MTYGRYPYGGVGYAGSDVAEIPVDADTHLAVEVSFTTGPLEEPVWLDITTDVREWDVLRGRNRALERFQPGRATVVLSNLSAQYDSLNTSGPHFGNLKPNKRIRIRETFNGATYPVFDGFLDKIQLDYPGMGKDATAAFQATDAMKLFNRTDLPISVYDMTVLDDSPTVYWRLDEQKNFAGDSALLALNHGTSGPTGNGTYVGPPELGGEKLVVGDPGTALVTQGSVSTPGCPAMGVFAANAAFSPTVPLVLEAWAIPTYGIDVGNIPMRLFDLDSPGGNSFVNVVYNSGPGATGHWIVTLRNSAGTTWSTDSSGGAEEVQNVRYHIVVEVTLTGELNLWVNGTLYPLAGTTSGTWDSDLTTRVAHEAAGDTTRNFEGRISHVAVYTGAAASAVDQAWVDAHYAAGTSPWQGDTMSERLDRVLDLADWPVSLRELDTGSETLQSAELNSQSILEHSQKVGETEYGGLWLITRDGKVRLASRNTVFGRQPYPIPFGDAADGSDVGYRGFVPDDGDEVVRNRATISRLNGVAKTEEDATSITDLGRFQYTLEGLLHDSDIYSLEYAQFIVAQYAELSRRFTSLTVGPPIAGQEDVVYPAMLGPELGDAITVQNTPLGGAAFEQVCAIEGVHHVGRPKERAVTWALSPEFPFRAVEDEDVSTLGYAEATANQTGITTNVDLTGLTATVTVGSSRRIRITGSVGVGVSNVDTTARLLIQESTTVLQRRDVDADITDAVSNLVELSAMAIETPSAGSHTYKLTMERVAGTGNVQVGAASTHPAFILVEDIGPA